MPHDLAPSLIVAAVCFGLSPPAVAATDVVADLKYRLARDGVEGTNAHLSANWASAMGPFTRKVVQCDANAMQLALQLHRGTNAETAQAHGESLTLAAGRCPAKLLPLIPPSEVPQFCHVGDTVPEEHLKREIDRRIKGIGANVSLRESANGRACVAAYRAQARRAALGPWQTDSSNGNPTR